MTDPAWFRHRGTLAFMATRYLPWLAALSLVWEALQIPLYTIWAEAPAGAIAFAILHCTLGDVLIGLGSLAVALTLFHEGPVERWRWRRTVAVTLALALTYTVISEWLNTTLLRWSYSAWMPVLELGGAKIGLSPLLQWLIVPSLALRLGKRKLIRP